MRQAAIKWLLNACREMLKKPNTSPDFQNGVIAMTACAIGEEVTTRSELDIINFLNENIRSTAEIGFLAFLLEFVGSDE